MTFGEKVKELRIKNGLSQRELGERMGGITQQTVAQYEKAIEQPKISTVRKIANALDVKLYELVTDWSQFSSDELKEDLTNIDGIFFGKEAENEMQQKFSQRIFASKTVDINKKLDLLNEVGQKKAEDYISDLSKIPEYRKSENNISTLNAAHARTEITPTPEGQAHDNAIMDDDSEWK